LWQCVGVRGGGLGGVRDFLISNAGRGAEVVMYLENSLPGANRQ